MHVSDVGTLAVLLAWGLAIWAIGTSIFGAVRSKPLWIASGRQAAFAVFACVAVAVVALLHGLLTRDFNLEYVAGYSSSTLPVHYTIAALWGGQAGSLLFWTFILTFATSLVLVRTGDQMRLLMPWVTATLMVVALFFLSLLVFVTPPFARLTFTPAEGSDLNPLLQNYWMMIHPPSLYLGYVTVSIPFAFCVAALVTGQLGDQWIRATRRWTLFAWFFLTAGNVLGGAWAYETLGWGGYWAWDPVENAAFMPWLVMTAFLHSVMIQEKKDMLKVWNVSLIVTAFALTIFGTFLTRSGVVSSVHSFTQSGLGPFFLWFLAIILVVSIGLVIWRLPELRSQGQLESYFSREAAFLFNNLILLAICFSVFWGTIFPVISEWVRGVKITVGPPFFNRVNAPLGMVLLFLTGVGPVIAWRRASMKNLRRGFLVPAAVGFVAGLLLFAVGVHQLTALVAFSLCAFVLSIIVAEYVKGIRVRRGLVGGSYLGALFGLVARNRRRYGGYVIHLGVVFVFLGITGSSFFRMEVQETVGRGETVSVGRYDLRFDEVVTRDEPHVLTSQANLTVFRNGKEIGQIEPQRKFFKRPEQPATEVAIRTNLREDLYVIFGSWDPESGLGTFQVYLNPLVAWIWLGGIVMILGTAIVVPREAAERRERALARQHARARAEAGAAPEVDSTHRRDGA